MFGLTWLDPRTWLAIGCAALLAFAGVQSLRLAHAKSDLKAALAQVSTVTGAFRTEQAAFRTIKAALDEQNESVAAWKAKADAWEATGVKAQADTAKANAWRLTAADKLRRITLPANTTAATRCEAAEAVLREAAR